MASTPTITPIEEQTTPLVSVITPTLDGDDDLAANGLQKQSYERNEYLSRADSRPMSVVRNELAKTAKGDILAFLHGDARPAETWIEELVTGFRDGAVAVGGPALPEYDDSVRNDLVPDGWDWLIGAGPYYDNEQYVRNTYGCNFAIRADVFDALGGFDEKFGKGAKIPQSEETDLAKRMYKRYDERTLYRPQAKVYHRVTPDQVSVRALLRRSYNQGIAKAVVGVDEEERGAVFDTLRSASPWEFSLLTAAGFGYITGRVLYE